jgi:hypothetical protein
VKFKTTGEPVTKSQIDSTIPEEFSGKGDFVRFYMQHNGGSFNNLTYFYRDTFREVGQRDQNLMCVFNFLRIPGDGVSDTNYRLSIPALREAFNKASTDVKIRRFLKSHIPIAGNGSGDYFWIEIPSGRIQLLDHESVGEGLLQPIEIAPTFLDFVSNFRVEPREEDKVES